MEDIVESPPAKAKKRKVVKNIMAIRYEKAYNKLYSELPVWKQVVIKECRNNNNVNKKERLYDEFVHSVAVLAESQQEL